MSEPRTLVEHFFRHEFGREQVGREQVGREQVGREQVGQGAGGAGSRWQEPFLPGFSGRSTAFPYHFSAVCAFCCMAPLASSSIFSAGTGVRFAACDRASLRARSRATRSLDSAVSGTSRMDEFLADFLHDLEAGNMLLHEHSSLHR